MSRDPKDPRNKLTSQPGSALKNASASRPVSMPTPNVPLSAKASAMAKEANKARGIFPESVDESEKMRVLPEANSQTNQEPSSFSGSDPYQVYGPNPGGRPPAPDAHRKKANLTSAVDVLQALLQNSKSQLGDGFVRWRLEQNWNEVVGDTLAQQSLPVAYEHKILYLWVRHPAWQQQLRFFTDAIKDKVNTYLGRNYVEQVRFTLNRRAATREIGSSDK